MLRMNAVMIKKNHFIIAFMINFGVYATYMSLFIYRDFKSMFTTFRDSFYAHFHNRFFFNLSEPLNLLLSKKLFLLSFKERFSDIRESLAENPKISFQKIFKK